MAKILVVDDETDLEVLVKQKFRKQIRENIYEFVFAVNGQDALEKLAEHPDTDLMLCDINMPVMDGLTLLNKLRESNSLIKSVIVSAYGDMDNIRTAMNRGAFDFITKPVNFQDLELTVQKTIQYVTQIRHTLQAVRENKILRMYVDETVLKFMDTPEFEASLLVNETVEASVVFIDICGFTAIAEKEAPNVVVKLLNHYFDIMVSEIIAQSGYIDKFIGDAIMAVFKGEYHLDRALEAALSLRNKIKNLPELIEGLSYFPELSIGINTGEMISGNIGSANLRRLDYTVIGNTVNLAARLQAAADKGQILISEENYLKVQESFSCNKVGEIKMKNKEKPVLVYEVIS
jgi:class 3 adenylate cyclase